MPKQKVADLDKAICSHFGVSAITENNTRIEHFISGWKMWPEWWSNSTAEWQAGYNARAIEEGVSDK